MAKCPKCGKTASVVWKSQDGKTIAVRCHNTHFHDPRPDLDGPYQAQRKSNIVFLMEVE